MNMLIVSILAHRLIVEALALPLMYVEIGYPINFNLYWLYWKYKQFQECKVHYDS